MATAKPKRKIHPAFVQRGGVERDNIYVGSYEATPKPKRKSGQTTLGQHGRKVLKAKFKQTGSSSIERDKKRKAMQPGKRRSASGRIYTETRKNRSDLRGSRV